MTKTKYFDFSLYLQGIKKIRLLGIIAAAIVVVLNLLAPAVMATSNLVDALLGEVTKFSVNGFLYMPASVLLLFFAPLSVLRIFSYLSSRSESDFYHSIPHSRPCVYISFMAAAVTWIWAILLTTATVSTLAWAICPGAVPSLTDLFFQLICYLLSTLVLMGFAAVAVSLTGTPVSSFVVFVLLTFFFRVVSSMFLGMLDTICPVLNTSEGLLSFFKLSFFMPLGLLASLVEAIPSSMVYTNFWCYLYTILLAGGLLTLGCVAYTKRKSESATRSAPNRKLQALYRFMITTSLVLGMVWVVLSMFFSTDSYDYMIPESLSGLIVLGFLASLVYFLYELIFTKSIKEVGRAFLQLPILLAACVLVGATALIIRQSTYSTLPEAAQIQSVAICYDEGNFLYPDGHSYEEACLSGLHTEEERARVIVSNTLSSTVNRDRNRTNTYGDRSIIVIRLNNGRTLVRNIIFDETLLAELEGVVGSSPEYQTEYLSMPSDREISSYYVYGPIDTFAADSQEVWKLFLEEYNALSVEEKTAYKQRLWDLSYYADSDVPFTIRLRGSRNGLSFSSSYYIPTDFEKTNAYILDAINQAPSDGEEAGMNNLEALRAQLDKMKNIAGEEQRISEDDYYSKSQPYASLSLYDPADGRLHGLIGIEPSFLFGTLDTEAFYKPMRLIANDPAIAKDPTLSEPLLFMYLCMPAEESADSDGYDRWYTYSYSAALCVSRETADALLDAYSYENVYYDGIH